MTRCNAVLSTIALLTLTSVAAAHPGGGMHNMMDGAIHPLTGIDHLLAIVAVGAWAALGHGRRVWLVPVTFIASLVVGLIVGRTSGELAMTEALIAFSVVAVGLLIAGRVAMPTVWACAAAGGFALFHGLAHGAEIPADVSAWHFTLGLIAATALLHAAGVVIGLLVRRTGHDSLLRLGGAAVACCGLLIAMGVM